MKFLRSIRWLLLIAILIITLDQITKGLLRNYVPLGEIWSPWEWLTPYARLVHWTNTGVAFGLFQGKNWLFIILAIIVSGGIVYYYPSIPKVDWLIRLALSMQLGGAVGNLIDRIFIGHVTDFISVGNFAVFNVADASITVGVVVLLIGVWVQESREKKLKASQATQSEEPTEGIKS
jgi:signal peptidase II